MTRPWKTIGTAETDDGTMTLLKRDEGDFLIKMNHYILMNSKLSLTELALAKLACERIESAAPRVLIGGLGMGYTLKASLDATPDTAKITVAELNPVVVEWCKGPLAALTDSALTDSRVQVVVDDVAKRIGSAAAGREKFDGIILDLYQGTHDAKANPDHPIYGYRALRAAKGALNKGGVFAAWTEERDMAFEKSLEKAGFAVERKRPGKGGPRHVIYLGKRGG